VDECKPLGGGEPDPRHPMLLRRSALLDAGGVPPAPCDGSDPGSSPGGSGGVSISQLLGLGGASSSSSSDELEGLADGGRSGHILYKP
jgi:hypothetical protein